MVCKLICEQARKKIYLSTGFLFTYLYIYNTLQEKSLIFWLYTNKSNWIHLRTRYEH